MIDFFWKSLKALDQLFWLCLPVAAFFAIVAVMMSTELPRLHELALEMEPVVGKLLSKEVRFVPHRKDVPTKGYWCAFGMLEIGVPEVAKKMQLEGQLSRIRRASKRGHSIYSKPEAEADLAKFEVGTEYSGWIFKAEPEFFHRTRPYDDVWKQMVVYLSLAGGLLAIFVARIVIGLKWRGVTYKDLADVVRQESKSNVKTT